MKIKVDNWLTFDNKNEWFNEIKENELNYYTDIYSPWQTKQRLKIWREVEGNTNLWTPYVWYFTSTWTWLLSVTTWFKPSLVTFTYNNVAQNWIWNWAMTSSSQFAFDYNSKTSISTQCIYCRNSGWTAISRAVFLSMDTDWFTIDFILATENVQVWFIAYP